MSKPCPTLYPELNSVLQDVVDNVQAVLSHNFASKRVKIEELQRLAQTGAIDLYYEDEIERTR